MWRMWKPTCTSNSDCGQFMSAGRNRTKRTKRSRRILREKNWEKPTPKDGLSGCKLELYDFLWSNFLCSLRPNLKACGKPNNLGHPRFSSKRSSLQFVHEGGALAVLCVLVCVFIAESHELLWAGAAQGIGEVFLGLTNCHFLTTPDKDQYMISEFRVDRLRARWWGLEKAQRWAVGVKQRGDRKHQHQGGVSSPSCGLERELLTSVLKKTHTHALCIAWHAWQEELRVKKPWGGAYGALPYHLEGATVHTALDFLDHQMNVFKGTT